MRKNALYLLRDRWRLARDFVYPIVLVLLLVWIRSQLSSARYDGGISDTMLMLDKPVSSCGKSKLLSPR